MDEYSGEWLYHECMELHKITCKIQERQVHIIKYILSRDKDSLVKLLEDMREQDEDKNS